jgi:hypothetical protein
MIDIPLGKALVVEESINCEGCLLAGLDKKCMDQKNVFLCDTYNRTDEKWVIYKLVDYPAKGEK